MFESIKAKKFDNSLALHIVFSDKSIFDEMRQKYPDAYTSTRTTFYAKQVHFSEVKVLSDQLDYLGELAWKRKDDKSLTLITSTQQEMFSLAHSLRDKEQSKPKLDNNSFLSQRKEKETNKAALFQPAKEERHIAFNIIDRSMDSDGHSDVYYTSDSSDSSDRMLGYFVDAFAMCLREPELLESVMRYALKNNQFQPGWAVEKMLKTDYRAKGSKLEEIYKKVKSELMQEAVIRKKM